MTNSNQNAQFITAIEETLPHLRRYARALSGAQRIGDSLAGKVLEKVLDGSVPMKTSSSVRVQLFAVLHTLLEADDLGGDLDNLDDFEVRALQTLSRLDRPAREALLLSALEGFSVGEIAAIRNCTAQDALEDIQRAQNIVAETISGKVMIIEDESLIALELSNLVEDLGHEVTGVAPTYDAALALGRETKPDLILADIKLADDRTGLEAVETLRGALGQVPTIFVTAYPELFLSGKRPEPAFLIAKPFTDNQIRTAVGQAMFFASTETLTSEA